MKNDQPRDEVLPASSTITAPLPTVVELCRSPGDFLGPLEIAVINYICAVGTSGARLPCHTRSSRVARPRSAHR